MEGNDLTSIKGFRDAAEGVGPVRRAMAALGRAAHPNVLTAARALPGLAAVPLHLAGLPVGAAASAVLSDLTDWVDGAAARASGRMSAEGARLDPLVDKVVHGVQLAYLAVLGIQSGQGGGEALAAAAAGSMAVNWWSQSRRGPLLGQFREAFRAVAHPETCSPGASTHAANFWGKTKFALESGAIAAALLADGSTAVTWSAAGCLAASVALGVQGVLKRAPVVVSTDRKAA